MERVLSLAEGSMLAALTLGRRGTRLPCPQSARPAKRHWASVATGDRVRAGSRATDKKTGMGAQKFDDRHKEPADLRSKHSKHQC